MYGQQNFNNAAPEQRHHQTRSPLPPPPRLFPWEESQEYAMHAQPQQQPRMMPHSPSTHSPIFHGNNFPTRPMIFENTTENNQYPHYHFQTYPQPQQRYGQFHPSFQPAPPGPDYAARITQSYTFSASPALQDHHHHHHQFDDEEEPTDVLVYNSTSPPPSFLYPRSLSDGEDRPANARRSPTLHKTRSTHSVALTRKESNGNLSSSEEHEQYESQLVSVTQQLEKIKTTQDTILSELSDDISNLQFENVHLKNTNEHLTSQNSHLMTVISDLTSEVEHMREVFRVRGWTGEPKVDEGVSTDDELVHHHQQRRRKKVVREPREGEEEGDQKSIRMTKRSNTSELTVSDANKEERKTRRGTATKEDQHVRRKQASSRQEVEVDTLSNNNSIRSHSKDRSHTSERLPPVASQSSANNSTKIVKEEKEQKRGCWNKLFGKKKPKEVDPSSVTNTTGLSVK